MAKTIRIDALIAKANSYFENSPDSARMERIAVQTFLSNLLMDCKAYKGFGYCVPYGEPGADSSRIFFYAPER
jgi:hypothetical protein